MAEHRGQPEQLSVGTTSYPFAIGLILTGLVGCIAMVLE
jgi:ACR3 family arsenite efflux pump ArsB